MSAVTQSAPAPIAEGSEALWALRNVLTITWRNLMAILRIPELLFFSTLQPIMFVLLFRYVFAGAIGRGIHYPYVQYMMPGIFVQTVAFGAVSTAIGLSDDLQKGLIERFRSLPMSRTAVLAGRTLADVCRNVFVFVIMTLVGLAVGFRPSGGAGSYVIAFGVMLLFAYALSWGFAYIGLAAKSAETAQVMAFPLLFPLTFASSCFVPVQTMPGWLQGFANNQPLSQVADAARNLMVNYPQAHAHQTLLAIAWTGGFLLLLVPISVRRFRNAI